MSGADGCDGARRRRQHRAKVVGITAAWKVAAGVAIASVIGSAAYLATRGQSEGARVEQRGEEPAAEGASPTFASPIASTSILPPPSSSNTIEPDSLAPPPVAAPRLPRAPGPVREDLPTRTGGLVEETALLDDVRKALRESDPRRAKALLDTYERRFPRGELASEAESLRARAGTIAPIE